MITSAKLVLRLAPPLLLQGSRLMSLVVASLTALSGPPARPTIERVVSPGGIEAWVVRDRTVPLIAVEFAFRGGADQDPDDKPGVANLAAGLLDEGAGDLDAKAFQERLERKAIELQLPRRPRIRARHHCARSRRTGTRRSNYLRLALTEPRFDHRGGRAHPRADHVVACSARPRARTTSPAATGGRPPFPAIPMDGRSTARLNRCRASPSTTCETYTAPRARARQSQDRHRRRHRRRRPSGRLLDRTFGALPAKARAARRSPTSSRRGWAAASWSSSTCRRRW